MYLTVHTERDKKTNITKSDKCKNLVIKNIVSDKYLKISLRICLIHIVRSRVLALFPYFSHRSCACFNLLLRLEEEDREHNERDRSLWTSWSSNFVPSASIFVFSFSDRSKSSDVSWAFLFSVFNSVVGFIGTMYCALCWIILFDGVWSTWLNLVHRDSLAPNEKNSYFGSRVLLVDCSTEMDEPAWEIPFDLSKGLCTSFS